jgi:predicted RNA-binding Zn-ribbon protein involved in translation (DUF1610 family)
MVLHTLPARKQPRDRVLRCLNCFARMDIPPKKDKFTCPKCNAEYEIGWRAGQAKILGLTHYFED